MSVKKTHLQLSMEYDILCINNNTTIKQKELIEIQFNYLLTENIRLRQENSQLQQNIRLLNIILIDLVKKK